VQCAKWLSWTLQLLLHVSQFLKSEKQITLNFAVFIAKTLFRASGFSSDDFETYGNIPNGHLH